MSDRRCSRGWGTRCPAARGPRCTCACGGENHGNPAAGARSQGQEQGKITDAAVFERPWNDRKGGYEDQREFLPGAHAVADIHLVRETPRDPGFLGSAVVNIERRFVVHSPTGFEWGYGGSGPADLALNILGLFVPPPEAWRLHHDFKFACIAPLSWEGPHTIRAEAIRDWIEAYWSTEAGAAA